jgi:hypothetical protein
VCWWQGIKATQNNPNQHLYQSIAMLAGEMGYLEESRNWFREATRQVRGKSSHALWHAWATLEAEQVRTLPTVPSIERLAHQTGASCGEMTRAWGVLLHWGCTC